MFYIIKCPYTQNIDLWKEDEEDAPGILYYVGTLIKEKEALKAYNRSPIAEYSTIFLKGYEKHVLAMDKTEDGVISTYILDAL